MFNFLKKKVNKVGPEQARALGLITEKEQLKIEFERAEENLKNCLNKKDKKKKK